MTNSGFQNFEPEITHWDYDAASGVLLRKRDDSGNGPTYTHYDSGLVHTRTWEPGVVTTCGYDAAGELTSTSCDGTPSVTRTHAQKLRKKGSEASDDFKGTLGVFSSLLSVHGGASPRASWLA